MKHNLEDLREERYSPETNLADTTCPKCGNDDVGLEKIVSPDPDGYCHKISLQYKCNKCGETWL